MDSNNGDTLHFFGLSSHFIPFDMYVCPTTSKGKTKSIMATGYNTEKRVWDL